MSKHQDLSVTIPADLFIAVTGMAAGYRHLLTEHGYEKVEIAAPVVEQANAIIEQLDEILFGRLEERKLSSNWSINREEA